MANRNEKWTKKKKLIFSYVAVSCPTTLNEKSRDVENATVDLISFDEKQLVNTESVSTSFDKDREDEEMCNLHDGM